MNKRLAWIDVLRGLGIVAVVVGHVTFNRALAAQIFMFHMPLFFLLGGWLHDPVTPQRDYLKAKARSLLLPYVCFLVILWPLEVMMSVADPAARWSWPVLVEPMLYGGQMLTGFAGVLWFVTCYFLTQQLSHFLLRRFTLPVCAGVCGVMLATAWLTAWLWPDWALPLAADVVLFAAPLYLLGYAVRDVALARWTPLWIALTLGAVLLNVGGVGNTMDMKAGDYGLPIVTLVSALAVVALLAVLAQRLQATMAGRTLAVLGGASMTIMFLHQFVQLMMAKQFGITQALPRIAGALVACWLMHRLLCAWPLAAQLFLGRRPAIRAAT
ncbi:acyltransferase family protein [Actimicrobium sp. GrIS 1.19]|uniref:acyltransferase family protein n=1 Tax=Actimicrobium sp. GrIS 1.19 TaxID=3071708 RepID=UPI002E119574